MLKNGLKLKRSEISLPSAEATHQLGYSLGQNAQENDIFCLFGPLGAGKTTLIQGLVEGITQKPAPYVNSPTFILLNIYQNIYHFDLYRLSDSAEFLKLGFEEYLGRNGIACIEWSERIENLLTHFAVKKIFLEPLSPTERRAYVEL